MKQPYSISSTLISLLLLTFPLYLTGAPVSVVETCTAVRKVVSAIDSKFCESTLKQNLTSVVLEANSTRVFANISATAAVSHARSIIASIQDLLTTSPDLVTTSGLKHCNGLYYYVVSSVEKAVEAINEKNDDAAKIYLSAGMNGVISCESEFEKAGKPSPMMEMNIVSVKLVTLTHVILQVAEENK